MRFRSLDRWLHWQERLHPRDVDFGLSRISRVWNRLGPLAPNVPVITVGGTNGKGSAVAYLETAIRTAGHRVGAFTSPHLMRYNERIRIDGVPVADADIVDAFAAVDDAREDVSLTYFEFSALAALTLFKRVRVDAAVLEVGVGGRLDAVNIVDSDVAIVTSLGLDHQHWLGDDLESIGHEKAGIFRAGCPAIVGATTLPDSVRRRAEDLGSELLWLGRDFDYRVGTSEIRVSGPGDSRQTLPLPRLGSTGQLRNAVCVYAALCCLRERLNITARDVGTSFTTAPIPGRLQHIGRDPEWVLDVAHNADAVTELRRHLDSVETPRRTVAVFGLLADRDASAVAAPLAEIVDAWIAVSLEGARKRTSASLAEDLRGLSTATVRAAESVISGLEAARTVAGPGDRIVVFGSFHTVGPALEYLGRTLQR